MTAIEDPWSTGTTEPTYVTRSDREVAGARALIDQYPWEVTEAWDNLPVQARQAYITDAAAVLDAAYPQVRSAADIEALPQGTLIVSTSGLVYVRALVGGLNQASGTTVGTLKVWEQPGAWESGRKVHRLTSQQVAAGGQVWTVVRQVKP